MNKKTFYRDTRCCFVALATLVATFDLNAQSIGPSDSAGKAIEEIMVTATRREERAQDVPISITAITADDLVNAGVTSTRDLALVTPGLRVDQVGAYVMPVVRGVSSTLTGNNEANVATYIDGVYQASELAAIYDLPDVKQVEVLKGPQGTLFGRNATGGAILIRTMAPDLSSLVGRASVDYSSFKTVSSSGFISVPIIEGKVAASLSGFYEKMKDGYLQDQLKGGDHTGGDVRSRFMRGKVRFLPWEGADFTLEGMRSKLNNDAILKNSNWKGHNARAYEASIANPPVPIASRPHDWSSNVDSFTYTDISSVDLRGDIEIGPGTFSTTTAYLDNKQSLATDGDNSPFPYSLQRVDSEVETFSQEFLYSTDQLGKFRATVGTFYFNSDANQLPFRLNDYALAVWQKEKTQTYAVFGEGTYDITDRLSLTAGMRYSDEEKEAYVAYTFGTPVQPSIPKLGDHSWNSLDPRVSLLYELSSDTNVYFTWSTGFKSGAYNTPGRQAKPVKPEKINSYEVGIKSAVNDSLVLNAAGFYYDYKDLQVTSLQTINGLLTQRLTNAAEADIWGAELSGTWDVTNQFRLTFGATYLNAEYSSFQDAVVNTPVSELADPGLQCLPQANGDPYVPPSPSAICARQIDASGNTLIRSPEWTGNLTAQYSFVTNIGLFDLAGTYYVSSRVYFDADERITQPSFEKLNVNLSWRPQADSGLTARVWGRNLTDSDSLASLISSTSYDAVTYTPPRSYGIELSYDF